jgi:ATP-dependent Clp protease ATP-binding subunit ClpA
VVVFKFLKPEDVYKVVDQKLASYSQEFSKSPGGHPVNIELQPEARDLIVKNGYQKEFGVRSVTTFIDTELASQMATQILKRRQEKGGMYIPDKILVTTKDSTLNVVVD